MFQVLPDPIGWSGDGRHLGAHGYLSAKQSLGRRVLRSRPVLLARSRPRSLPNARCSGA